jgi:phosphoglycerol geranylgeranyltransferase
MKFKALVKQLKKGKRPLLAVLIDPDKFNPELISMADTSKVACFLVGGSRLEKGDLQKTVLAIKKLSSRPVVLFPGDETQLSAKADGLLLLSLLSGRNPEYLIEKHVKAAPFIKKAKLEHLSTAYILVNGGKKSATEKVSGTEPLDPSNTKLILHTAMAAEQLGFGAVYLEAGKQAAGPAPPCQVLSSAC